MAEGPLKKPLKKVRENKPLKEPLKEPFLKARENEPLKLS